MRAITLSIIMMLTSYTSYAEDKVPVNNAETNKEHTQMHENMAKAHQQAADCLKAGKSLDECRNAFHETCKEFQGSEKCGPFMKRQKMWKKNK